MDQNQERRRGHYHRGRRSPERRGTDRRAAPPKAQDQGGARDHVDVEKIMLDIRARIAQRHGIELSNLQIQELAARRLEAILDPRSIRPSLLDELRRSAGAPAATQDAAAAAELTYEFEDTTLYESHRGLMRFMRRLLHPLLKLFFNPNPLIRALNIQAKVNAEVARRETERDRRQTEWNALHYELVHRMVSEVSKVSLELQGQSSRIESLATKVDFNERRVRGIEGAVHQTRPSGRSAEPVAPMPIVVPIVDTPRPEAGQAEATAPAPGTAAPGPLSDGARRRRRRRRGRRGSGGPGDAAPGTPGAAGMADAPESIADGDPGDEGPEDEGADDNVMAAPAVETAAAAGEPPPAPEPAPARALEPAPERPLPVADLPERGPADQ